MPCISVGTSLLTWFKRCGNFPRGFWGDFLPFPGLLPFCRTDAMGAESGGTMRVVA